MAEIMIFRGKTARSVALRTLLDCHKLYFVSIIMDAMKVLHERKIDLIICSVYDESTDAFIMLKTIKQDSSSRDIPILFFSDERSPLATFLDKTGEKTALLCGANKYLSMDSYCNVKEEYSSCKTCPFEGEQCDYASLRRAIEDMLLQKIEPLQS